MGPNEFKWVQIGLNWSQLVPIGQTSSNKDKKINKDHNKDQTGHGFHLLFISYFFSFDKFISATILSHWEIQCLSYKGLFFPFISSKLKLIWWTSDFLNSQHRREEDSRRGGAGGDYGATYLVWRCWGRCYFTCCNLEFQAVQEMKLGTNLETNLNVEIWIFPWIPTNLWMRLIDWLNTVQWHQCNLVRWTLCLWRCWEGVTTWPIWGDGIRFGF